MSEQPNINQTIKGTEYAATSATGNATVTITNYYYREDVRVAPLKRADTADDENLPCPYRGLFHFSPDDAEFFFGRELFVEELVSVIQTRNFIPVLGASGSGKSSVVLAGLVPRLQREGYWKFTHFRPGSDPFQALALALVPLYTQELDATDRIAQARKLADYFRDGTILLSDIFAQIQQKHPNYRVLVIADQLEELYTFCRDEAVRRSFLDNLLASFQSSASKVPYSNVLVGTMRADFLGNALSYPPLADILKTDIKLIGSMNRSELLQVIEKPSIQLGVTFEAGLVERILGDVENEPGHLPLLEFALTLLWERRTGKQLTHADYKAIGEVQGALASYADENYAKLNPTEQKQVRRIFIQLVRPGEGTEDTRRFATKSELGEASWDLVKQLADARLVVTSRSAASLETVEVVHEALIRNWGELRQWMATDRNFRAWQERLRSAMRQWEQTKRDSGALLRGAALAEAQEKLQERREEMSPDEQDFIQQSLALRDLLLRQETERKQRELEQETKARKAAQAKNRIALGSILIMTVLTFLSVRESLNAKTKTIEALSASSRALFSSGKGLDSLLEALRAGIGLKESFGAENNIRTQVLTALQQTVYRVRERNRFESQDTQVVWDVASSSDGKLIVSAGGDNTVRLWKIDGTLIKILGRQEVQNKQSPNEHTDQVFSVSFSPDGQLIASASADKTVKLWRTDGRLLKTFGGAEGHTNEVVSVKFSPDSKLLASSSRDNTIKIWRVDGALVKTLRGHIKTVRDVSFSPDGQIIASASFDGTIRLWHVADGVLLKQISAHSKEVNSLSFSPDGKMIASASDDKTIKIWGLDGQLIHTLQGNTDIIWSVSFSPNGQMLVSSDGSGNIKLWQVNGKEKIVETLRSNGSPTYSVSFVGSDNTTLVSSDFNRTITVWNITSTSFQEHKILIGHTDRIWSVDFNKVGIVSASADNTFKLWDTNGTLLRTFVGHENSVTRVSFNPNGKTIASASLDKTVKLWNIENGNLINTFRGHTDWVWSVSFSPDGKMIASAGNDKTIRLWKADGSLIKIINEAHSGWIFKVEFSPNGQTIASASRDKTIKLWRVDGSLIRILGGTQGHSDLVSSVSFSPNGKLLASSSTDKTVKLWRVEDGKLLATFRGHQGYVIDVNFSPDGKMLASASWDGTVKLWQLDGTLIRTLQGHSDEVNGVSFDPLGKRLASGSKDRTVILWKLDSLQNLDLDSLISKGCSLVSNYLKTNPNLPQNDRNLCDRFLVLNQTIHNPAKEI